ncbi:MAG: IgGFc-binding protein, partial [Ignavibacteria bacterium]
LAIPINAFGTEYVVASYPQYTAAGSSYELPAMTNIIAAYDDPKMPFTMGGTSGSITSGGLKKGQKATFSMNKGDVVCFANNGDAGDVAGSLVKANKPIGVVSGNQCANVPSGVYACDYISEMELPTFTWGKEYHVTPIVGRQKAPVIRVFAKEKDTRVFRDGQDWMRLTLNSRGEGDAFIERRAFDGDLNSLVQQNGTPCKVISADKPIYVMLYNPGQTDDNVVSDPFQLVLTPLEQYQKEIVFATPNAKGGSLPFTRQFVNLVYENTPDGAIPDDLEFATVVNGKFTWKKVSVQFGPTPGFKFAVPIRGKNYSMKRLQLNGDGVFRIRSSAPFAAYAYGFASYDSYGFPTSVALGDLEKKDTVKPDPKWKVLCDGSVVGEDGSGEAVVTDKPDDPNVRSNLALIYMDLDSSYNYEFDYDKDREFIAGTTIKTDWSLKVIDPAIDARAWVVFVDRAGNDTIIEVMYKAFAVDIEAKDTDFGKCKPNEVITKSIDLVNKNKNSSAVVKNLTLKTGGQGFTILNATFPITIPAGGKVTLQVSFTKDTKGEFRDAFLMDDGCVIAEKGTVKAVV